MKLYDAGQKAHHLQAILYEEWMLANVKTHC